MSAIHQALKKADGRDDSPRQSEFNPLAQPKLKNAQPSAYYFIAFVLFVGAALLFFWPESSLPINSDLISAEQISTASTPENQSLPVVKATRTVNEAKESSITVATAQHDKNTTNASVKTQADANLVTDLNIEASTALPLQTGQTPVSTTRQENTQIKELESIKRDSPVTLSTKPIIQPKANTVKVNDSVANEDRANNSEINNTSQTTDIIRTSASKWQKEVEQFIANGQIEQAESKLKSWISSQPKAATPRILLAKIYLNNGLTQAAEPLVKTVDHPQARALAGIIYERTQRPALAADVFEQLYRDEPQQHKWLLFWAINSENSGQLAKSSTLYQNYLTGFSSIDANLTAFAQKRLQVIRGQ